MATRKRCQCCRRVTKVSEAGARVHYKGITWIWCLPCWDTNPEAVEQYRSVGL